MPLAWFLVPYKRKNPGELPPRRYCEIHDFRELIHADGGAYDTTEVLGNAAIVKVRASDQTLQTINDTPLFFRLPLQVELNESLSTLTLPQLNAINNRLLALGYTQNEINAASGGDWRNRTMGQLLQFIATRRLRPRYDEQTDTIIVDGVVQPVKSVESVAAQVT